jgi:hypothetical protein
MNDDAQHIKAALDRRFARAATPPCPDGAWRAAPAQRATIVPARRRSRGFAYAAALLGVVAIGGLAAQASSSGKLYEMPFMRAFVSSKPLQPMIHRADRLTIAQAQRRTPFTIVELTGLPAGSRFVYAAVSEQPHPRVALTYEAHIASKYYRIAVNESTVAAGPPVAHFEVRSSHGATKKWDLPLRRFKHGAVVMDLFTYGLPDDLSDRIVRSSAM